MYGEIPDPGAGFFRATIAVIFLALLAVCLTLGILEATGVIDIFSSGYCGGELGPACD